MFFSYAGYRSELDLSVFVDRRLYRPLILWTGSEVDLGSIISKCVKVIYLQYLCPPLSLCVGPGSELDPIVVDRRIFQSVMFGARSE